MDTERDALGREADALSEEMDAVAGAAWDFGRG
jgi:hypothetical protein